MRNPTLSSLISNKQILEMVDSLHLASGAPVHHWRSKSAISFIILMAKVRRAPPKDNSEHEGTALSHHKAPDLTRQMHACKARQVTQVTVPPALHSRGMTTNLARQKNPRRNTCLFSGLTPLPFSGCVLFLKRLGREGGDRKKEGSQIERERERRGTGSLTSYGSVQPLPAPWVRSRSRRWI